MSVWGASHLHLYQCIGIVWTICCACNWYIREARAHKMGWIFDFFKTGIDPPHRVLFWKLSGIFFPKNAPKNTLRVKLPPPPCLEKVNKFIRFCGRRLPKHRIFWRRHRIHMGFATSEMEGHWLWNVTSHYFFLLLWQLSIKRQIRYKYTNDPVWSAGFLEVLLS